MNRALVLYHGSHCRDGFASAFVFWCATRNWHLEPEFMGVNYGYEPPDCTGRDVFILDFCYSPEELLRIAEQANSVTVLDHHASAVERVESFMGQGGVFPPHVDLSFSQKHSGAMMTWNYVVARPKVFHLEHPLFASRDLAPHWIVRYVQDRDLWKFLEPDSRAVNAVLQMIPLEFPRWEQLVFTGRTDLQPIVSKGLTILEVQELYVQQHVPFAKPITIGGYRGYAVNATVLQSEIAQALARKEGAQFGACFIRKPGGSEVWSLRSIAPSGIDVMELAKSMGGGGHKHASGFQVSALDRFNPWVSRGEEKLS